MKNLLRVGFTLFIIIAVASYVEAVTIVKTQNVPKYDYYNDSQDAYDRDLIRIERDIFNKTFRNNNLQMRLNRIEKRVFNRTFSTWNPTRRINHILANYKRDYNRRYVADYQTNKPIQRIRNRVIGQPTGFTPSMMDMPFGGGFGNAFGRGFAPGYSQGFGTNTGYGFINSIPAMTGAGIRILD